MRSRTELWPPPEWVKANILATICEVAIITVAGTDETMVESAAAVVEVTATASTLAGMDETAVMMTLRS